MPLEISKKERITVITILQPTLEVNNVPALWDEIEPLLPNTVQLVIDLSRVEFIDSTGFGIFLNCVKRLGERNGELKICGLSDKLAALFRLMAFERLVGIHKTSEEAIDAFEE